MTILVTGAAGFIGFHTAKRLLDDGHVVVGYDGFTEYYDLRLKTARHNQLEQYNKYIPVRGMLEDSKLLQSTIREYRPEVVIHLAAQAGVRYSIENPAAYIESNIRGTFHLLEGLRVNKPRHLLFASTSSVYGANDDLPFSETTRTAFPVSLYAATKSAGESMTHAYSSLYDIPTTCFRFFTVYGPWGRPDMAPLKFIDRIRQKQAIEVYGHGEMSRDFTFIDDLVESVVRLINLHPKPVSSDEAIARGDSVSPSAPWRVVNIAGGSSVPLMRFIRAIENALDTEAEKVLLPMQPGDVPDTLASSALLYSLTGYRPDTSIEAGIQKLVDWYEKYYGLSSSSSGPFRNSPENEN